MGITSLLIRAPDVLMGTTRLLIHVTDALISATGLLIGITGTLIQIFRPKKPLSATRAVFDAVRRRRTRRFGWGRVAFRFPNPNPPQTFI